MQAHKYPEAIQMMEKARASGGLKTEAAYINLAKLYLITGQEASDLTAERATRPRRCLQEGMSKGVVKPSAEAYILLGEAAEFANKPERRDGRL